MDGTKIKICGLSRMDDIDAVNAYRPDFAGFIFYEKSKRHVTPERAAKLSRMLNPSVIPVGVFVNEDISRITRIYAEEIIECVQLHGSEDDDYIKALRRSLDSVRFKDKPVPMRIIKAYSIRNEDDIAKAGMSIADMVLLDNGAGGSGKCFDWRLLMGINRKYILAGGLDITNLDEAVRKYRPFAVDLNSGVETDGVKDAAKIRRAIRMARDIADRKKPMHLNGG